MAAADDGVVVILPAGALFKIRTFVCRGLAAHLFDCATSVSSVIVGGTPLSFREENEAAFEHHKSSIFNHAVQY
jgi:hypothetical protein